MAKVAVREVAVVDSGGLEVAEGAVKAAREKAEMQRELEEIEKEKHAHVEQRRQQLADSHEMFRQCMQPMLDDAQKHLERAQEKSAGCNENHRKAMELRDERIQALEASKREVLEEE